MGIADRLKGLTGKAKETAAEHKDQVHKAVENAEALADQRTGGKYHDQIAKAGNKAEAYVEQLQPAETDAAKTPPATSPDPPRPPAD